MFKIHKKFLLCRRYEKDIWGYITAKHKTINLGRIKVRPNVENVPHLAKSKRLLQDFSKRLNFTAFRGLNFSFEIIWRMKKKKPRKMKNRMRFFFLTKILWIFYGNLRKETFKTLCNKCLKRNSSAVFFFLKIFEFWLPMFIYWIGFAPSFLAAREWVMKGLVYINNKIEYNSWKPIKLYDFIGFSPKLWSFITINITRFFYYGSKATRRRRCTSSKLWSLQWIARAHFISQPEYIQVDYRTFSFYWHKEALPNSIKYYFPINLSNILKFVTI